MHKYFPLVIVTIAEATIGIFVKLTGDAVPIFTLHFYRVLFAFLLITAVMPFLDSRFYRISRKEIVPAAIIGLLIALQISFFNTAMKLGPVANAVVFWSAYPFFVFIFSSLFLNEKPRTTHFFIFLLAIAGIVIAKPLSSGNMLGNFIAMATSLIFASLITYMRFEDRTETTGILFWFFLFTVIFLLPLPFIFGFGSPAALGAYSFGTLIPGTVHLPKLLWILALGMFSTGTAYLFITFALQRINANLYSLVDIIVSPLLAAIFAFLFLGEIPSTSLMIGGAILLISGFWLTAEMSEQMVTPSCFLAEYFNRVKSKITEEDNRKHVD